MSNYTVQDITNEINEAFDPESPNFGPLNFIEACLEEGIYPRSKAVQERFKAWAEATNFRKTRLRS